MNGILDAFSSLAAAGTVPVTLADLKAILPALVLFLTGSAVLVFDLVFRGRTEEASEPGQRTTLHFLALLGTVIAGALALASLVSLVDDGHYFLQAVRVDSFSSAMSLLIVLGTLLSILGAPDALRRKGLEDGEFHCLVLYAAGAMVLFAQSANLILLFLSLETLSMAVYTLTAYTRDEKRSVEGALKYFILGGFSTGFLLLGLAFLYGATGEMSLSGIAGVLSQREKVDAPLALAGAGLVLVGLGFKVGAFPFQWWVPDAYEGAASVVTGFMAVTVKVAGFAVLLRTGLLLGGAADPAVRGALVAALSTLAFFTMVFGNLVAIFQASVKRMLAYSAIAHTGYLLVGVVAALGPAGAVPAGGGGSGASVIFYLFPYALMTAGAFTLISHLGPGGGERETFAAYGGMARKEPLLAAAILLLMVSFAGIPPTPGFWGKFFIFREAIATGHVFLALTGILTSVVSLYYYLRVVVAMYMEPAPDETPLELAGRSWSGLAVVVCVAAVALIGLFPDLFFELSQKCAPR
jgi:NADH-quinone oxidoreductase subunit N